VIGPSQEQFIELQQENDRIRQQLAELQDELADSREVIEAIRSGEVDAVVVSGPDGEQVFTLRGAEAAYRALVEAMNEGAATLAADGTLLYCNQHLAELLGVPLDQIMGRPISDLLGLNAMDSLRPLLDRALRGVSAKAELDMYTVDGRSIPTQVSISRMKIEEPTALCMVVTDLTESKKWEELISAGKLTKSILDSSAEGIAVCDSKGNIQTINGVLKRMSGSNPILEHFDKAFPLEIRKQGETSGLFSISASLSGPIQALEVWYRAADGSELTLLVSSGQIPDGDGIAGCVLTLTDITSRKRVENALVQSEKLAVVGRMASSIAHEINNPLESVTNLLYIAARVSDLDEVREHLQAADRELRRVSAITNQTLRFHKQSTSPTEITGEELLTGVLSIYQGRIINSNIRVEMRCHTSHPVRCFEGEIRQVLSNLIGNAIDAMHSSGGRLLLACRKGHDGLGRDGLFITVADNGPGMTEETRAKAFEPFYTTKGFAGTGLGLWVSQEIIDRHHGRLRLRSTQCAPGHSTVATFFLPFKAALR
jgi:PAS domain S-box-containing protein